MPEEQTKALSLIAAYGFGAEHGLAAEIAEIRNMAIDGMPDRPPVRRGYIAHLFRDKGLLEPFIQRHWAFGGTPDGAKKLRYYERLRTRHQQLLGGDDEEHDSATDAGPEEDDPAQSFGLESDLRDFLANNLSVLEPGLRLYDLTGRNGVEFSIDHGQIDILAVDRDNKYVVIELKLSRGRNRALGQLLYYMGWVDQNLSSGPCRGMVVASEISDEVRTAVRRVPGVALFRYRIAMSVEPVSA
jgi:hypothetical protein